MNNSSLTPLDVKLGKDNLWTKDFLIICMANFFVALTFYLLMTTLALYAVEQFNTSQSKAGLLPASCNQRPVFPPSTGNILK